MQISRKVEKELDTLSGYQFHIFKLLISSLNERNETSPLKIIKASEMLAISRNAIKLAIYRLKTKKLIELTTKTKVGRGGYRIYKIPVIVVRLWERFITSKEFITSYNKTVCKYVNKPTTYNGVSEIKRTLETWSEIDVSPLAVYGFKTSHLIQVQREHENKPELSLSVNIIQDSINAMAFDLKHNNGAKDFKKPPAVVLTSLLKQGKPYSSKTPEEFKTPQQEAMDAFIAFQEKQQEMDVKREEKIKKVEFEKWQNNLSEKELLELCPESEVSFIPKKIRKTIRVRKAKEVSKEYFNTEVWSLRKKAIIIEMNAIAKNNIMTNKTAF